MRRIVVDPNAPSSKLRKYSQFIESDVLQKVDFSKVATDQGTSVSSVAWSSVGEREVDITSTSLSSSVASGYISSEYSGFGTVQVKATLANSNVVSVYFDIDFHDPEARGLR